MPSPPSYQKVNPADQPVLFLTLQLADAAAVAGRRVRRDRCSPSACRWSAASRRSTCSARRSTPSASTSIRRQLAARQIGIDEVADAIANANVNLPTGTLYGPQRNFVVQANGQLMDAQSYRPMVVAYRNGSPVRLERGRARLRRRRERRRTPAGSTALRTIYLAIQRQPGTNTVEVVDAIKALLPQLQAQLPAALSLEIRSDRSVSIRESVARRQVHAAS